MKTKKSTASKVRERVQKGGPRLWSYSDFDDLPWSAVAATLSRLQRAGEIRQVRKGVYYKGEDTPFGPSRPSETSVAARSLHATVHPAGLSAANALGLTTQNPARAEFATTSSAAPSALRNSRMHVRRPSQRASLSAEEGAILETLRTRATSSDLPPEETKQRLLQLASKEGAYRRLAGAATAEPPRVRAMLGAIGQELGMPTKATSALRASLNPLSRFDFGVLRTLRFARKWQAK